MSDVALIMALPNESKGLFEQAGIEVHYSGIGKVNAAYKAFEQTSFMPLENKSIRKKSASGLCSNNLHKIRWRFKQKGL